MKQAKLRRALLLLSILCLFFLIYLFYWQQSPSSKLSSNGMGFNQPEAEALFIGSRRSVQQQSPQWTWQCINLRCERRHVSSASATPPSSTSVPQSLATCSMLCGSTQLWPQPTGLVKLGTRAVTFNHNQVQFLMTSNPPENLKSLLKHTFHSFNESIQNLVENRDYLMQPTEIDRLLVYVRIRLDTSKLLLKTNESYKLAMKQQYNAMVVNITAETFFGARHGIETLSQLIWWDEYLNNGVGGLKILKGATIQDRPVFAYRGLMIDTARNFMSIESLKRVINGMAANKLNVFHWHLTDSQSFPLFSERYPQLARTGAYSPQQVYYPNDIRKFVEFANAKGIRVVLEIDTPAHSGNGWTWGPEAGLGDLAVCVNERPWNLYCGEPPCGQLNPDNPNVYKILEDLYRELLDLSGEREIFHIGGDEVNLECWAQHLQKVNTLQNYTDLHDLWGEFTLKVLSRLTAANENHPIPQVLVWSSKLSKRPYISRYLNQSQVVVQSWGASQWPDTPDLIADGYKVLISHVDAWYLDCGFGRWREGSGEGTCDPYRPWQQVYNHRPWQQLNLDRRLIIGGEACLWSEQLDETSLDARLWPRAAAFAERLWSDPALDIMTFSIQEDVYTRLNTQRERLVKRGLKAEALWPRWCVQNPGMCL